MAETTGIVLAVGGLTAANELLFAPLAGQGTPWKDFNWRIVPATAILAVALGGLEKVSLPFAKGLAYIALITVVFAQTGSAPAPAVNLAKVMGYNTKAV
jgi:hypothetical protein